MVKRLAIYLVGMVLVSLGIVLCAKCNLGISPISSVPFVLDELLPLSFGQLTMLFHLLNTGIQLALLGKLRDVKTLLQVPVALLFSVIIDFFKAVVVFDNSFLPFQLLSLALSVLFTAFGMVCMIRMALVQNPPDGTVRLISARTGLEFGKTKILYDIANVVLSVSVGLIFLGKPYGFGVATVVSAVLVGRTVSWLNRHLPAFPKPYTR